MDIDTRVYTLEQDMKRLFDRMGKVEDKAASAWNTIREVNQRMDKIEKRMETVEADVKQIKSEQQSITKLLKILMVMVAFMGVISVGFFIYIWKHDAQLAQSILTLGGAVSKAIPLIP